MNNITSNPLKAITRKGAGRTKGSFSFVSLSQAQMQQKIADPNFKWLVSRKQAENLGFENLVTSRASELQEAVASQAEESKVPVSTTDL